MRVLRQIAEEGRLDRVGNVVIREGKKVCLRKYKGAIGNGAKP